MPLCRVSAIFTNLHCHTLSVVVVFVFTRKFDDDDPGEIREAADCFIGGGGRGGA